MRMVAYEAVLAYSRHGCTNVPAPINHKLYPVAGRTRREHLKEQNCPISLSILHIYLLIYQ